MTKSSTAITLMQLIKPYVSADELQTLIAQDSELSIRTMTAITLDSRDVVQFEDAERSVFLATKGHAVDARQFIAQTLEQGCGLIFAEKAGFDTSFFKDNDLTQLTKHVYAIDKEHKNYLVLVEDLHLSVSKIAAKFYRLPTRSMSVVGITGTNGKTSVCALVCQALQFLQHSPLMLSTLGNGVLDGNGLEQLVESANTTPDPVAIQQLARQALDSEHYYMAMEVSSHAMVQARCEAVDFNVAVFTNLTQDHLDYHGDMESYFAAKRELFVAKTLEVAVINADDAYGRRLLNDPEIQCKKIAYSCHAVDSRVIADEWVVAESTQLSLNGVRAQLITPWGRGPLLSKLLGQFNVSNLLAVAGVLGALLGDVNKWLVALNNAEAVAGRMHHFVSTNTANVVVDYAHTPDALEKALNGLRTHCDAQLWCVFGCGGDRDTSKRALMGAVAAANADHCIITDDNPRTEDANAIVEMIRANMDSSVPYIASREAAISHALTHAHKDDMILVAGKGHEDYQIIGTEKSHYSDLETVERLLEVAA